MQTKINIIATAMFVIFSSIVANAGPAAKFTKEGYLLSQSENRSFVIGIHEKSCGSCKVQKPIVESLLKTDEFKDLQGLFADYETDEDLRKELKVGLPSTLILMKGKKEIARVTGVTDKTEIARFLKQGLSQ